jgi:adenine-specific DNA-methyltransferase
MLTKRQKEILDFIEKYIEKNEYPPSIEQIKKHFKLKSVSTIHEHIESLKSKGYLKNKARTIQLSKKDSTFEIPIFGTIAAGQPLDVVEVEGETITISDEGIDRSGDIYALRVSGNSMVDEGIFNNDIVVIKKQSVAENGQTIVAIINNNEATLKKFYKEKWQFRLQPANPLFAPIYKKKLEIRGIVVKIIRDFQEDKIDKNEEFTNETIEYINQTDIKHRKSFGQYFTPKSIREALIEKLPNTLKNPKILDPGCGTGEFLITAQKYFKNPKLYGWDVDNKLVDIAKKVVPDAKLENKDSLFNEEYEKYDFVIGNPPYFEFKPSKEIKNKFNHIINGRVNIFNLFVYQGIKWLKDGGYLAYVIPPSMNNGAYFSKLREFIVDNTNIEYLHILDDPKMFKGALQSTMLLILKKGKNKGDYLFRKNGILLFSENVKYLNKAFKDKMTLYDLGYEVKTGRLVWNQNKKLLTNKSQGNIPLIWSRNITSDGLKIPIEDDKKPQYVKTQNFDVGPAIVVNRITGSVKSTKIKAAIIPAGMKFIGENHVNVIFPPNKNGQAKMNLGNNSSKIKLSLESIVKQLSAEDQFKVVRNITGNTQISKTELEKLFPIKVK